MATERFDEALAQFDRVMELDPNFRAALEGKGFTYMVMDRLDDALATFEQVRELTPHPKGGITPLAIALAFVGRTTEAEELLTIIEERERGRARRVPGPGLRLRLLGPGAVGRSDGSASQGGRIAHRRSRLPETQPELVSREAGGRLGAPGGARTLGSIYGRTVPSAET